MLKKLKNAIVCRDILNINKEITILFKNNNLKKIYTHVNGSPIEEFKLLFFIFNYIIKLYGYQEYYEMYTADLRVKNINDFKYHTNLLNLIQKYNKNNRLDDLYTVINSFKVEIDLTKSTPEPCRYCQGTGICFNISSEEDEYEYDCEYCDGTGEVVIINDNYGKILNVTYLENLNDSFLNISKDIIDFLFTL